MISWILIGAAVIVVIAIFAFIASRLKTVKPNEAMMVVNLGKGAKSSKSKDTEGNKEETIFDENNSSIHTSGRVFVIPVIQDAFTLKLNQRRVDLKLDEATDKNFIKISVAGNLQFKFADDPKGLFKAAQRFYGMEDPEILQSIQQSVEGMLRSIVSGMTYSEINNDRQGFQTSVLTSAKAELAEQGILIDTLNIVRIETPGSDYSKNLAARELAEADKNARIAQAQASQLASAAEKESQRTIAEQERNLALKKAEYKAEVDRANAEAEAAGQIAQAEQKALIAAKAKESLAAEALVKEQQLDIDQKKPADAAAYAAAKEAEGRRLAAIQQADANVYTQNKNADAAAYAKQKQAEADAAAKIRVAEADAAAVKATGLANAEVISKTGEAEANATQLKADALAKYGEQGLVMELLSRLPEMMKANASAVAGIDNYTVISNDGASEASKQAIKIGNDTIAQIEALTGIKLSDILNSLVPKNEPDQK